MQIPQGDWICDLCKEIGNSGRYLRCPLCQEIGGAMKKSILTCETTTFTYINPSFNEFLKKCQKFNENNNPPRFEEENPLPFDIWAHVTCVLWMPETYFQDKINYATIRGIENIDNKKFESFCHVCQMSSKRYYFNLSFFI